MDLIDSVNAHTDWKIGLRGAIADRATLDLEVISRDDSCELGRWLHGDSTQMLSTLSTHQDCVRAHARFHVCAAEVAALINAGNYARAERMLGPGSRYALASRAIVLAIEGLKREMDDRGANPDRTA
jgi:hypothetical protein